jgi:hypothetical protein
MDEDQIFFQREEHAVRTHSEPVFAFLPQELFNIALQIGLEFVEFLADLTALLLWERTQLLSRLIAKFESVTHEESN